MPITLVKDDIVNMKVGAIVNMADPKLAMDCGLCGAILAAAGEEELRKACKTIGDCGAASVAITRGYNLPCAFIIHAVSGGSGEQEVYNCCQSVLKIAAENNIESVAFPIASPNYPEAVAVEVAMRAICDCLENIEMQVFLVSGNSGLNKQLQSDIENYIDENFYRPVATSKSCLRAACRKAKDEYLMGCEMQQCSDFLIADRQLEDVLSQLGETFSESLLRLIDERGLGDVETYKRANIDRKLFSKIRSERNYNPSKSTAIAFAVALRLNIDETNDLLGRAGFTLSNSSKADLIVSYFIEKGNYNIFDINEALFVFNLNTLN